MKKTGPFSKIVYFKIISISLLILLSVFILLSLWFHRKLDQSQEQRYLSYIAADELRQSSDDLTRMVRTYVVTKDPRYEKMYWDILAIRNGEKARPLRYENIYWDFMAFTNEKPRFDGQKIPLLEIMEDLGFTQEEFAKLAEAETQSNSLVRKEMIAMHAMKGEFPDEKGEFTLKGEPDYNYARSLMHDESYHSDKVDIMTPIDEFFVLVNSRTEAQVNRDTLYTYICVSLAYVMIILLLLLLRVELNERKKAEDTIRKLNEELEDKVIQRTAELETANKELEAFSYSVSHDLRAPLTRMDGFSKALQTNYTDKLDEKGVHYLDRIRNSSQLMAGLIDDLLILSRISRRKLKKEVVYLSEIAEELLGALQNTDKDRKIEMKIQPDVNVTGDASLLKAMMENLLNNAWKFTREEKVAAIDFGTVQKKEKNWMFVKDNGTGFDMKYYDKLFTPFQRLHSGEYKGSGIGLSTVQRIINKHGGEIHAESEPGKGTTFYFII